MVLALGGDGDDRFFVGEGGGNLISGGAGADQFWIYTGNVFAPANTIIDFQAGTDVIGLVGAGLNFGSLTITGNSIALAGTTLATLTGFTGTLTATNFAFSPTIPTP